MLSKTLKKKVDNRLRRIEGQVGGIRRMVEDDKYCVDILNQVAAVEAALRQVAKLVLGQHIETCVADAMTSGDDVERRDKIDELVEVFAKYNR